MLSKTRKLSNFRSESKNDSNYKSLMIEDDEEDSNNPINMTIKEKSEYYL